MNTTNTSESDVTIIDSSASNERKTYDSWLPTTGDSFWIPDILRGTQFSKVGRHRRIADVLKEVTAEAMVTQDTGAYITRMEIILRYVVEQAMQGNLWCIQFIAERMEGKPTAYIETHHNDRDLSDIPTADLIEALDSPSVDGVGVVGSELAERFESRVQFEVNKRLALMLDPKRAALLQQFAEDAAVYHPPPPSKDLALLRPTRSTVARSRAESSRPASESPRGETPPTPRGRGRHAGKRKAKNHAR